MRFYQLEFTMKIHAEIAELIGAEPIAVTRREWFGSERDAVVCRLARFSTGQLIGKKSDHPIEAVDVPTDKANLLLWLNRECV